MKMVFSNILTIFLDAYDYNVLDGLFGLNVYINITIKIPMMQMLTLAIAII